MNIHRSRGSGGGSKRLLNSGKIKSNSGTKFSGWFITAFLGVRSGDLMDGLSLRTADNYVSHITLCKYKRLYCISPILTCLSECQEA